MIEGEKVRLRRVNREDIAKMLRWDGDPDIERYIGKRFPGTYTPDEWYNKLAPTPRRCWLAIETKGEPQGEFIGSIELEHIEWVNREAELRICIGNKRYWGRGYGSDAVLAMLYHAFNGMGLKSVYLRVFRNNLRAIECYKKCGFRVKGILRRAVHRWRDFEDLFLMTVERSSFRVDGGANEKPGR